MVKRNLTGSGYGLTTWLQQRITAIIMLIFTIVFFGFIILTAVSINNNIFSWQNIFSFILVKIFVQIFFISLILHAWIGIRDIWMDYIVNNSLKLTLHIISILWLLGCLIYSIKIIWA